MAPDRAASRRAAAAARVDTPILLYAFWMWLSAVLTEIPNARAICLVCNPRARRPMTSVSRCVSPAGRSIRVGPLAGGLEDRPDGARHRAVQRGPHV